MSQPRKAAASFSSWMISTECPDRSALDVVPQSNASALDRNPSQVTKRPWLIGRGNQLASPRCTTWISLMSSKRRPPMPMDCVGSFVRERELVDLACVAETWGAVPFGRFCEEWIQRGSRQRVNSNLICGCRSRMQRRRCLCGHRSVRNMMT